MCNRQIDPRQEDLAAELAADASHLYQNRIRREHRVFRLPLAPAATLTAPAILAAVVDPCLSGAIRRTAEGWRLELDTGRDGEPVGVILHGPRRPPTFLDLRVTRKRVTVIDAEGDTLGHALLQPDGVAAIDLLVSVIADVVVHGERQTTRAA